MAGSFCTRLRSFRASILCWYSSAAGLKGAGLSPSSSCGMLGNSAVSAGSFGAGRRSSSGSRIGGGTEGTGLGLPSAEGF